MFHGMELEREGIFEAAPWRHQGGVKDGIFESCLMLGGLGVKDV